MPVRIPSTREPSRGQVDPAEGTERSGSRVVPPAVGPPFAGVSSRDAIALQRSIGNHITSIVLEGLRPRTDAERRLQRAVPTSIGLPKPQAETGSYVPRGGGSTEYDAATHPRSKFSFGSNTRDEVLRRPEFSPQIVGHNVISVVCEGSQQQVNVQGIQLDHSVSWDSISGVMMSHNRALHDGRQPFDPSRYYTLHDAKQYYNDQPNLKPALAGLNASAGAAGVRAAGMINELLQPYVGQIQTSFMNLQQALGSGAGLGPEAAAEIEQVAIELANVRNSINEITDRLF